MLILALFLMVMCCAVGAYWLVAIVRVNRIDRMLPRVREGLDTLHGESVPASVTIIVPAHNEEDAIEACARSLLAQDTPILQTIFALDRCTDETSAVLRQCVADDDRVQVLEIDHCPEDWFGKPHALHTAAQNAQGDWLLFVDSDTRLDPSLVRAAIGLATTHNLDMLSLLTTLTVRRPFERVAQPVATMVLMRLFPPVRLSAGKNPRGFANGQFILIRREMYERTGFAHVRGELTEDIALAKAVQQEGRVGLALADGMFTTSMYESFEAFASGWRRIFTGACGRKVERLTRHGLRVIASGLSMPILLVASAIYMTVSFRQGAFLLSAGVAVSLLIAIFVQGVALARIYQMSNVSRITALFYPLGCLVVGRILLQSARALRQRETLCWAGRDYTLDPR